MAPGSSTLPSALETLVFEAVRQIRIGGFPNGNGNDVPDGLTMILMGMGLTVMAGLRRLLHT
jgi:hypothetical protein